ncbi:MAG: ATP-dependent 6-phosphofructokinase [Desulfobacterales bacterium]|nr:ATP-dependent 6-phosphofructokinase [Desulfobacterales bacterium]MBF0398773.1 ATP-dependent 6-phosphofructokinase [Desulfobacterales bacterium]
MKMLDTSILTLGKATIPSPLLHKTGASEERFISDDEQILIDGMYSDNLVNIIKEGKKPPTFEIAGPRSKIYFDPSKLRCALTTCGGLCPGLNDIIRSTVFSLHFGYGVRNIYGIRYGLQGFIPQYKHSVMDLTPSVVSHILEEGGTILGSSRGPQDVEEIVNCLERMNIGALFMIGGDGTLMAALKVADEVLKRGLRISVIGIPKTIDNDIHLVARSFGFDTAVDVATRAIIGAHNEALAYPNGIGLIKLMGRHSGFIAATAALAQQDVNFVLIPEVEFDLEGPNGLFANLEKRLKERSHSVIVVAEGAGQNLMGGESEARDESGNVKLKDIGTFLKGKITQYFTAKNMEVNLKYIDPSYMIRSLPANANDRVFCNFLGRDAVHAAMAGKTKLLIGHWNNHFVHVPMNVSAGKRKQLHSSGKLWLSVLQATGQGSLKNDSVKVC